MIAAAAAAEAVTVTLMIRRSDCIADAKRQTQVDLQVQGLDLIKL